MGVRLAALLLLGGIAAASSSPPASPVRTTDHGDAAAWVLRMETASGPGVRVADAVARSGAAPRAEAAPFVAGDTAPVRATADPARPGHRAVATPLLWTDPSGSLTMEGAFAEASASPVAATSRAGFGAVGGTGFPLANRLFTWEQQERLLAQMTALNNAVFVPLNARIAALTPLLDAAGLVPPRFEPVSPVGLVDVGAGRLSAASAEVARSGDFASGRAEVTIDRLRLLGGFVDAAGVSAEAVTELGAAGSDGGRGGVWFAALSVAGVPVVADGERIRVAGNDAASRAVVQPALDLLLAALREHGVNLRVGAVQNGPDGRRATALELAITAPAGSLSVSVAGAEVNLAPLASVSAVPGAARPVRDHSADAVRLLPPADTAPRDPASAPEHAGPAGPWVDGSPSPPSPGTPAHSPRAGDNAGSSDRSGQAAPTTLALGAPGRSRPTARRLLQPEAVARSLQAVYLVLVVAAAAGAVVLPAVIPPAVRADRRRRSR